MAIELFKPFVMREIVAREYAGNVKAAKRISWTYDERIWDILKMLSRNTQYPRTYTVWVSSLNLSWLMVRPSSSPIGMWGYNADFDGDQMAIHALSEEACRSTFAPSAAEQP